MAKEEANDERRGNQANLREGKKPNGVLTTEMNPRLQVLPLGGAKHLLVTLAAILSGTPSNLGGQQLNLSCSRGLTGKINTIPHQGCILQGVVEGPRRGVTKAPCHRPCHHPGHSPALAVGAPGSAVARKRFGFGWES
jgi:hypothetical protein